MLVQNFSADQFEIFFDQIFDDKIDDNSIKNFLLEFNDKTLVMITHKLDLLTYFKRVFRIKNKSLIGLKN